MISVLKSMLNEESSAWLQFKIFYKNQNIIGWKEFFDVDFPSLSIKKFESILKDCGVSDSELFFRKHKTPGSFLASPEGGTFIQKLKSFSNESDIDELIRIITDKYSKR